MDKIRTVLHTAMAASLLAAGIVFSGSATAGTIILEGSDAIGFHSGGVGSGGAIYRDQVWKAIGGASSLPIAVIGPQPVSAGFITTTSHPIVSFASVPLAGPLSSYVALYFLATGGCCDENDTLPAGNEAAISAYLTAGGTVMIENYSGNAAWDFAVGTGGLGSAHVAGIGGALSGPGCTDKEKVTADGLANGFTQPPAISCWTHQGYDMPFFGPLGFTHNFFDSDPAFTTLNPGFGPFSSLLSSGVTVTGAAAPEPGTLAVLALGLLGLGWSRRKAA